MTIVKQIQTLVDRDKRSSRIELQKPDNDYLITQIQVGKNSPRFVDENSIDVLYENNDEPEVHIIQTVDTEKVRERFGTNFDLSDLTVKEKISLKESESSTHQVFTVNNHIIRKDLVNLDEENITNVSKSYIFSNKNSLNVVFFIDFENLIKEKSVYNKVSKNIKFDDEFNKNIEILDCKIYRQRIYNNLISNDYPSFFQNQADDLVDTKLDKYLNLNDSSNIVAYKFIDSNIKDITFGKYRYYIELVLTDPLQNYISNILLELSRMIKEYDNIKLDYKKVSTKIEKDIVLFKKYEQFFYGKESETYIGDSYTQNLFSKKINDLYYNLYEYQKSFSHQEETIKINKTFKEYYDVDKVLNFIEKINILDRSDDILTWKEKKDYVIDDQLSLDYEYALEYSLDLDPNNNKILEILDAKTSETSHFEILEGFEHGVNGEIWSKFSPDVHSKIKKTKITKYFCRVVNKDQNAIENQYFIMEN